MIKLFLIFVFILCGASFTASAQTKDSFYFMKDDGIFSDEEKDEEAEYIYAQCASNTFQKIYYDCRCIAGAFRVQRDAEKLIPQDQILNDLLDDQDLGCVNTMQIAGDSYEFCMEYATISRSRKKNNDKYCGCVANKTALDFKKKPVLRLSNIEKIRTNALVSCARQF